MTNRPPPIPAIYREECNDFKTLLGDDWHKLHPDIQLRFSPQHCRCGTRYKGVMHKVAMSWSGWLLANFCRLLGTPLSYNVGIMVPTEVKVYPDTEIGGTTWDRFYHFQGNKTNRVRSTKLILPDSGLLEVAMSGFGMYSQVYAKDGAIVFESKRFFCTLGKKKIPIPHILSPGKTIACQRALDDGSFEFSLNIHHPVFGYVIDQVGIFWEKS